MNERKKVDWTKNQMWVPSNLQWKEPKDISVKHTDSPDETKNSMTLILEKNLIKWSDFLCTNYEHRSKKILTELLI